MKVNDIRPDTLLAGQQEALAADIALINSWRPQFVEVDCPACGEKKRTHVYCYNGLDYQRCADCGTQYISPRPTPELLAEFYSVSKNYAYWAKNIYPASAEARREKIFVPRARMIADICHARGSVGGTFVEVGTGYGILCEELRKLDLFGRIVGIEPASKLAQICRDKGIEIIGKPFETVTLDTRADVIASFEVIEHLYDPRDFVRWIHGNLTPGGTVILTCPNIEGLDTLMLAEKAIAVDHQHLNYFSPRSLRRMLENQGFAEIEIRTPGQLDVDLLRRGFKAGDIGLAELGPFLAKIIVDENPDVDAAFQRFLQDAGLSSNMIAIARKV